MSIAIGVQLESWGALIDAKEIIDLYGDDIVIYRRDEELDSARVDRDSYRSIKRSKTTSTFRQTMKAYPIIFQPNAKQIEKAGLKENCELIIYTAMLDWTNLAIGFEDIDIIRDTVEIRDIKYTIKEKTMTNCFSDQFLNISFGLMRT
jgi:hypothetical protein